MRRLGIVVLAGLLVVLAAAPASSPGCSCTPQPPGGAGGGVAAQPALNGPQVIERGVRRAGPRSYPVGTPRPTVEPIAYRHEGSGILLYFERDGQHVSGIDPNGVILWHVNPTEHAFRKDVEREGSVLWLQFISYVGPPQDWMVQAVRRAGKTGDYLAIAMFKEGGLLDVRTGEYISCGSD